MKNEVAVALFILLTSFTALAQEQPQPTPQQAPPTQSSPTLQPKVFIESASSGSNRNAARNQTIEMSKDFQKVCSGVKVTIRQDLADYTLILNHIEHGLFVRDNQIEVADKDGNLITTREKGSIKGNTKFACELILSDFAKTHSTATTTSTKSATDQTASVQQPWTPAQLPHN